MIDYVPFIVSLVFCKSFFSPFSGGYASNINFWSWWKFPLQMFLLGTSPLTTPTWACQRGRLWQISPATTRSPESTNHPPGHVESSLPPRSGWGHVCALLRSAVCMVCHVKRVSARGTLVFLTIAMLHLSSRGWLVKPFDNERNECLMMDLPWSSVKWLTVVKPTETGEGLREPKPNTGWTCGWT